jgi:thiosulfate/3-mercaptopyruvate sulfurtransferase
MERIMARLRVIGCLFVVAGLIAAPVGVGGQVTPSSGAAPLLVDGPWLAAHAGDAGLVIVHVAFDKAEYDAGHVAGARFLPFGAVAVTSDQPEGLRTELPSVDSLQRALGRVGVADGRRIVLVGQPIPVARLYFTLAVLGIEARASVLDGGVEAWREAGRALTRDVPPPLEPAPLTVTVNRALVATAADVRSVVAQGGARMLDARLPEFYFGFSSNGFPRAGHIAGAASVPFATLTRELGRFRDVADLDRLLAAAGAPRGAPVVTYCHVGQQASLLWFAARLAGRPARMYDGSFQEWSRLSDAPIGTTAPP